MGLGVKLNIAFITVVVTMVVGFAGYSFVMEYLGVRYAADHKLDQAINRLTRDLDQMSMANRNVALMVAQDPAVSSAMSQQNRAATADALSALVERIGFDGFITVLDHSGTIFYSTETPVKYGVSVRAYNSGIDFVLDRHQPWHGPAMVSAAGTVSITAMVPSPANSGIVAASKALDTEFVTGTASRYGLGPNAITPLELAIVSAQDGKVAAMTPDLLKSSDGLLSRIEHDGFKAVPAGTFDTGAYRWRSFMLSQSKTDVIGAVLLATPIESVWWKIRDILQQSVIVGGIALAFGFFFSASITAHANAALNFLIQRTRDLAAQKPVLPPLEGLSGQWLELGEFIDTAVASLRTTIQNLKNQLSETSGTAARKGKQPEISTGQLDELNRQLSAQSRQLGEFSRQIHYSNQQAAQLKQRLDTVMQISTEGFLALDVRGNILTANPVFLGWTGTTEEEIAGRHYTELVRKPSDSLQLTESETRAIRSSDTRPDDLQAQFYPDGIVYNQRVQDKFVEVIAHLQPVIVGGDQLQGWVMVLRDKGLRAENAQLRADIVSLLSESIRKPLTDVEPVWLNVMSSVVPTMNPAAGQQLAEIRNHYKQLLSVVDSLLMVYGGFVPPPTVPREQVSVSKLVKDTLEEMAESATRRKIVLDYRTSTGLPSLYTDRDTFRRILLQVLEKMISMTDSGNRVRIESSLRDKELRVTVTSFGPALPEDEVVDMFVGFIDGKHTENTSASRLSLYMARSDVERLGGKIWAEAVKDKGTSIHFMLPVE